MEKKYVSVEQYAKLCEISTQAIYKRIADKKIIAIHREGVGLLIDLNKYPPIERQPAGRTKYSSK